MRAPRGSRRPRGGDANRRDSRDSRRSPASRCRVELSSTTPYPRSRTEREGVRVLAALRGGELAAGQVEVVLDRRRVRPHDERQTERRRDRDPFAHLHAREPNGCGGPVTASITMSSPTPRWRGSPARDHPRGVPSRERVLDDAVAPPCRHAERDQRGPERVGPGARVATDQTALLQRAHDRVRARVAEVGPAAPCRRATTPPRVPRRAPGAGHAARSTLFDFRAAIVGSPPRAGGAIPPLTRGHRPRTVYHDRCCVHPICDDTGGTSVKLDLLYEIDAPRPWDAGPHPYGQRAASNARTRDASSRSKLADTLGFNDGVGRRAPLPRRPLALPGAGGRARRTLAGDRERIRLGFGVTLTPFGFTHPTRIAEKVATVDILSHGRVEWGTGRSTPMEQTAFHVDRGSPATSGPRPSRSSAACGGTSTSSGTSPTFQFPRRMVTPKPYQDPHPPCWMAATSDGSAEVAGSNELGLLSFSIMQPLEQDGRADQRLPRRAQRREAAHRRHHQQGRGVHARALRGDRRPGRRQRGLGFGRVVVPAPRTVHARLGAAPSRSGRSRKRRSRC